VDACRYPVIYTAEHPALAVFEKLAHAGMCLANASLTHRLVVLDVWEGELELVARVPNDPIDGGQGWLEAGDKPFLQVPSCSCRTPRTI
jgi:RES domain-containing protein